MNLLLDTHAFLWWATGDALVPRDVERMPLPFEERAIIHLAELPNHHRDPFDRMLICQAIEHDLMLVTADEQVKRYPVKTYWAQ